MKILILILSLVSVIYAQPTKTTIEDGTANSDALIWDGSKWINISKTAAQDTLGIMSGIYFLNNFAGANDSIKFKAALTELGTDATIFIPSGTYSIGTQTIDLRLYLQRNVTISGHILMISGASIEGEGETSIIRNDVVGRSVIEMLGTATATTSNLSDTALLNQSDIIVVDGSVFTEGDYVWIDGVSLYSPKEINQVILVDGDTITVKNKLYDTYLTDSTAKVTVINPIINTKIKNIKIINDNSINSRYLYATYFIDFAMENCYIDNSSGSRILYGKDITFRENKYRYTSDWTIMATGVKNVRAIDNDIDSCDAGIGFFYYSDGGIARGNTLRNILVDGIATGGWARNCVVSENHLFDIGRYGIVPDGESDNTRVINNEVVGSIATAIALAEGKYICIGNIVRNSTTTAITVEGSNNTIISGNRIIDCGAGGGDNGIHLMTSDTIVNVIVSDNIISGVSGRSIFVDLSADGSEADNIIISNNTIITPNRGIEIYGSSGVTSNNNAISGSGGAGNRFLMDDSSDAVRGDYTFITQKIDLSDAALTNIPLFKPNANGSIVSITIIMTEASSADSSRYLKIGKQSDTGYYLNILSTSQTLVSQAQWKKIIFVGVWSGEGILNQAVLTKDDIILLNYEGSKTGTGELIIQMEIVYYD